MPILRFFCNDCGEFLKLTKNLDKENCKCGKFGKRIFTSGNAPIIYEIRDKYRGVRMRQDLNRQTKERSHQHALKYKVDEIVSTYGTELARKAGYLNENGGKKTAFDEK